MDFYLPSAFTLAATAKASAGVKTQGLESSTR